MSIWLLICLIRTAHSPWRRQTSGTPSPIVVHPLPDVDVNKSVYTNDAGTYQIPWYPAQCQPGPTIVGPEVAVVSHILKPVAIDKSQTSGGNWKQVKDRVCQVSVRVEAGFRSEYIHDGMQRNE